MYHTKASFQITARGTYFKGKVREIGEEMPAASAPFKQGSCTLSSCRGTATPTGAHFSPFFYLERKKQWVCCCSPRASLPTAGRGCHRPPQAPKAVLAQEGGQSESCPSWHDECLVESPEYHPLLPRIWPQEDVRMLLNIVEKRTKMNDTERC